MRGAPIDSTVEMMKQMRIGKKYSGAKPMEKPSAVAIPFHRNVTGEFDDVRYLSGRMEGQRIAQRIAQNCAARTRTSP